MCFDTPVLIVSARLCSPFSKALSTTDTAWLAATSSHITALRENTCTQGLRTATTETTAAVDHSGAQDMILLSHHSGSR